MENAANSNPYGLMAALEQRGTIAWTVFLILVFMSVASWYIMFTKVFEQQKFFNNGKAARRVFWTQTTLKAGADNLAKNTPTRQMVHDGLIEANQHKQLTDQHRTKNERD